MSTPDLRERIVGTLMYHDGMTRVAASHAADRILALLSETPETCQPAKQVSEQVGERERRLGVVVKEIVAQYDGFPDEVLEEIAPHWLAEARRAIAVEECADGWHETDNVTTDRCPSCRATIDCYPPASEYRALTEQPSPDDCGRCHRCLDARMPDGQFYSLHFGMLTCAMCGNKRCPKASDHRLDCTGSNEPGQVGSVYGESSPDAGAGV